VNTIIYKFLTIVIVLLTSSLACAQVQDYTSTGSVHQVPTTVSESAQEFLSALLPMPGLANETVVDEAVVQLRQTVEDVEVREIAGVPVDIITPNDCQEDNDDIAIYIHGGGWVLYKAQYPLAYKFADDLGLKVYSIDYRQGARHLYPDTLDDCFAVYQELLKEFGAENVVMLGDSSGGNMVLTTVLKARKNGLRLPAAVALLSPCVDLTGASDSIYTNDGFDPILTKEFLLSSYEAYPAGNNPTDPLISPLYANFSEGFPPTIISTGTRDLLLSESSRLYQTMKDDGVKVELNVWEGMWHVFEAIPIPEAEESRQEIVDFLKDELAER